MSTRLNPPILENTLPAFAKDGTGSVLRIPFQLNRGVGAADFNSIKVLVKSVQSNLELYSATVSYSGLVDTKGEVNIALNTTDFPQAGQYYKVQIAFVNGTDVGFYSNVGIIKCIDKPTVYLKDREETTKNTFEYIGVYEQSGTDTTEKAYSYKFNLYNESGEVLETSGEQFHNSSTDTEANESWDKWTITRSLDKNLNYYIGYSVTTINGYETGETRSLVIEAETIEPNIYADLSVVNNFENGYNLVRLIGNNKRIQLSGSFVICRSSSENNFESWDEVCRFKLLDWNAGEVKEICKDYCLKQGYYYIYSIQAYNNNNLYSERVGNIEGQVFCDFEDCFLFDGKKQLKIKFNPKISSFKSTILESKLDTLGGKYPFIFRNGNVEYKEFSISGLLSLLSDDNGDFFDEYDIDDGSVRQSTPEGARSFQNKFTTSLTAENYQRERNFKLQALKWLTNGEPKLFKSPAEGNYIVRLMNTSLSPTDTLGRLLHTFTSTAYEIAEYNYSNLKLYKFAVDSNIETRTMSFEQVDLNNPEGNITIGADGYINFTKTVQMASITAKPNVIFSYKLLNGTSVYQASTNFTGTFVFPPEVLKETPLVSIKLSSSSWGNSAHLTYGYYNEPDAGFSYIDNINIKDRVEQWLGEGLSKNLVPNHEDIRLKMGAVHYLGVEKKIVQQILWRSSDGIYIYKDSNKEVSWNKNCIYELPYEEDIYCIDGNNHPVKTSGKYKDPKSDSKAFLKDSVQYLYGFKVNDSPMIDFSERDVTYLDEVTGKTETFTTFGKYSTLTNISKITNLQAGRGITINIVYQQREITYSVESSNNNVKTKKQTWLNKKQAYENALASGASTSTKYSEMQTAYSKYIEALEDALEEIAEGTTYVI